MKTSLVSRNAIKSALLTLLLVSVSFVTSAQCPTLLNANPAICADGGGYDFNDLNTYATDGGDGIVWYDAPTGGAVFMPNELVVEGTYYLDNNSGTCVSRSPITVDFTVNPSGQNLDRIYCSNENATVQTYIDDVLQFSMPSGGSVEVYNDFELLNQANPTDAIPTGGSTYFIVFVDSGGCESQLEIGKVGVFSAPADPTPAALQDFCADSNPTVGDLNPGTAATNFNWYAGLDSMGDPIQPAMSLLEPLVDGNTYYIQVEDVFCDSNPVAVTVNIDIPVESGTPGSLIYCSDSLPSSDFNLFDELGGPKDNTGSWSGPIATSNGHLGTVNISTLTTAGTYTFMYTVTGVGVCPDESTSVSITVYETLSSGIPSVLNPASFCEGNLPAAFDLFSLLSNEDPNGLWTEGTTSAGLVVTSSIDLTGFVPGSYSFTYTQNVLPNPCPEESTTVQVTVLADPNAGIAINQTFCENDLVANSPFDLFDALDGSQDHDSGVWTDSADATISNTLDITGFTVIGSPYVFNYTIDNGTCSDTEQISITIEPAPESGTVNASEEFCEGSAPASYDLFTLLTGADVTGTWFSGIDNLGASVINPTDLSTLIPGTYNFTYDVDAIGSCDDELVTVSIIINPLPNTGIPTSETYCENDLAANSPLDLFGQLSGEDSGGTWTDDDTSGALNISDVDLTLLTIGSYNFTYTITDSNGCTNSSTVNITVEDAPESGTANAPVEFCIAEITTGQTYDLFDLLTGADQTGTWNDDDTSGALSINNVTLDGLASGTYNFTYDVDAIGSCDDVDVTVSIIINDTPAPTASASQEFCDTATVDDLIATGSTIQWYDAATDGNLLANTTDLVDAQIYYATQTDATTGCESSIRTAVTAIIYLSPNPGNPNSTAIVACNDSSTIDLFTGLDGTEDAGGTWQNDDGIGTLTGNSLDATGVSAGTYQFTYTVTASAPCLDDSTEIFVTIEEPLSAGSDNVLDVCSNNGTTDLFTLLGSADTGGTWSPALDSGTGVFDPLVDADGTYTYTLTNSCGTVSSDVVVTVSLNPDAGTSDSLSICLGDDPTDLFDLLGDTAQSGGVWFPTLNSGSGIFDPAIDAAGTYTYTVTAISPCTDDSSAEITVTVNDTPAVIVLDSDPEFCQENNPTVADLSISIRPSGTVNWYEDLALTQPLSDTDTLLNGEAYYATQTNSTGCESSIPVQINVTINDNPTPTLKDASAEYCINDDPTIHDLSLNITEHVAATNNVIWYDSATGGTAFSESDTLSDMTYYAALYDASTGCESSVRLEVTPDVTACGKLILPDGFSPNGDGVNDTYEIDNLSLLHPNFEIEIYNRYGNMVYKGQANSPRFDGTSNQPGSVTKGDLPVGVYFYIFTFNDGENKPEQGRLYLSR
jgi:gliding motility-associated-like protein